MIKVNKKYVSMLWQALSEDPNMDDKYLGMNLNNEDSLNIIMSELIAPAFYNLPSFLQVRCKDSLEFVISFGSEKDLKRIYESSVPQFEPPSTMSLKEFHLTLWNYLFPNSQCHDKPKSCYEEVPFSQLYVE